MPESDRQQHMAKQPFLDPEHDHLLEAQSDERRHRQNPSTTLVWCAICLLASIALNLLFITSRLGGSDSEAQPSKYGGLMRSGSEPFVHMTDFSSENETLSDQLWHDINIDSGVVALSDEWAAEHDLRLAQRFPWDQSKGIYILHGYHNLHCLKIIRSSLAEYRHGEEQSRSSHHIDHCMDALRRQVLCDADDTPRATDRRVEVVSGVGQHRMCRSWEALEAFAKKHTACYKRPDRPGDEVGLDRYKHCPPGTGYLINDDYVPVDELLVGLPGESVQG